MGMAMPKLRAAPNREDFASDFKCRVACIQTTEVFDRDISSKDTETKTNDQV